MGGSMMEQITIGQVALGITFIVGLITGITYLIKSLRQGMTALFKDEFKGITDRIDKLEQSIIGVDKEATKNYLVTQISQIERGIPMGDIETERFWEQFERYTKSGGNSYIKRKVEQLKEEGKL
jgi:hypothetical protein